MFDVVYVSISFDLVITNEIYKYICLYTYSKYRYIDRDGDTVYRYRYIHV